MKVNDKLAKHIVWAEKYRPPTVDDCILPSDTRAIVDGFVAGGKIPNLLLHGRAGTGKTTLAKALCNDLNYEFKIVNGSNEGRLIDNLRTVVTQFASTVSFEGKRKCIIIDEADHLTDLVQAALRNFIDEYSKNCSFILTCNFPNKLLEPIHSRCVSVEFGVNNSEKLELTKQVFKRVTEILTIEGIEYDKKVVAVLLKNTFPDTRKLLNQLQKLAARNGSIDKDSLADSSSGDLTRLLEAMRGNYWSVMRSWVAEQGNVDFEDFCRKLYAALSDVVKPASLPTIVLTTSEYQYRSHFVGDKEINTVAYLTQLMMDVEYK